MSKPEDHDIQTSLDQYGRLFSDFTNPTTLQKKTILADRIEQAKHLREMDALRLKAAMRDRLNPISVFLMVLSVLTLVISSVLLFCFDDPQKTQGAITVMGAVITGWFGYLAGMRAG